jgi:hypothetical protein
MILFEANAVAPLVKLPDAAVEEIVQRDDLANGAKRKAPPLQKPQEWGTQLQRRRELDAAVEERVQREMV